MVVSDDSGFDANYRGFARDYGLGTGGYFNGCGSGSGHGGKGGNGYNKTTGTTATGGPAYGVSNAPVQPGSGGRSYSGVGADGGGLIWIHAPKARIEINGALRANGGNVTTSTGGGTGGGGSGGAVHIYCRTFEGSGILSAAGGKGFDAGNLLSGSGAGGRIAVHRVKHLWTGSPQPDQPDGRAAGGAIVHADWPGTAGEDGTIIWILLPRGGLSMKFH
jgi:hypothetical protein